MYERLVATAVIWRLARVGGVSTDNPQPLRPTREKHLRRGTQCGQYGQSVTVLWHTAAVAGTCGTPAEVGDAVAGRIVRGADAL